MQNKSFINNLSTGIKKRLGSAFSNPYREVNISPWQLKIYKHLSSGRLRHHRMFGKDVYFLNAQELLHGLKEIFIGKIYMQQLPSKPFIIDCGANIGLSVIYMKQCYPDAEILAFEPDDANFELLEKNIQSFGYKNVAARKEAVWTENTFLQFESEGSMSSKIAQEGTGNTKQVKAVRLKDYIERPVNFLKVDIEGAEYAVLTDLGEKLNQVHHLFVEYHGLFSQNEELNRLFRLFTENGFSYYIKEATPVLETPFMKNKNPQIPWDVQLNIFCFR